MKNKHSKSCSAALALRKMQIKTRICYHYTSFGMTKIKNSDKPTAGENAEKLDQLFIHHWLVGIKNGISHSGKQFGGFFKN